MLSSDLLITFAFLSLGHAQSTGSVTLFSDSACATQVFANNYTLAADICGSPAPSGTITSFDGAFNSYIVDSRPVCSDGSFASYAMYSDAGCKTLFSNNPYGINSGIGRSTDGLCLGLVEFLSVAFLCNGLGAAYTTSTQQGLPTVGPVFGSVSSTALVNTTSTSTTMAPPLAPSTATTSTTSTMSSIAASSSSSSSSSVPVMAPPPMNTVLATPTTTSSTLTTTALVTSIPSMGVMSMFSNTTTVMTSTTSAKSATTTVSPPIATAGAATLWARADLGLLALAAALLV
ncbi:hypothetical protein MMC19_005387 [Ptychographa xylographoides]|nr:hypothetical protein [Ptychographa xylographoides]